MEATTFVVRRLPGTERLMSAHLAAGQQQDNLGGVHRASIPLAADGISIGAESLALDNETPWPPSRAEGGADR
jgi:hypothetical protein